VDDGIKTLELHSRRRGRSAPSRARQRDKPTGFREVIDKDYWAELTEDFTVRVRKPHRARQPATPPTLQMS
jgi:hypothetical protein